MTDNRPADATGRSTEWGVVTPEGADVSRRLLADAHRRAVLAVLAETARPMDLSEVAAELVVREERDGAVAGTPIEDLAIVLHHNHLPKLDANGFVSYDADAKRVVPCRDSLECLV